MRNLLTAALLTLLVSGCGSALPDANAHYANQDMAYAFEKENAFCQAAAEGNFTEKQFPENLPPWGYASNFSSTLASLGYDHYGYSYPAPDAHLGDYSKIAAESFAAAKKPQERHDICMRELGWKNKTEFTAAEKQENNKNTRATTLLSSLKDDPQLARALALVSAELRKLPSDKAAQERNRLMQDPDNFSLAYHKASAFALQNPYAADNVINDDKTGLQLAHCSAMYGVVNDNRKELTDHGPGDSDRFVSQERESLDFASRLINSELALEEKNAFAETFLRETSHSLPNILMKFQMESPQCSVLVREFKNRQPQPDIIK